MSKSCLHLGCGGDLKQSTPEEKWINIDIHPPFDLQHDLRNPLPFEDSSVDKIYSYDVIQHFSRKEWKLIKKDWIRVLKPKGILNIGCWNFIWVLKEFLAHPDDAYAMQRIYAGQGDEFDYFKNGFTYEKLVADLEEEGMTNFIRKPEIDFFIDIICEKF